MGLEQLLLLEKLIKRFKMKPISTIILIIFLLSMFMVAYFFGVGLLVEKGRQAASDVNFIRTLLTTLGAVGVFSLLIIGSILVRGFLFPKYIWDENLKAFRNPKTNEILCSNCLNAHTGKFVLNKDTTGLFGICPKCRMVQELSIEEQKKALRDIVLTTAPHKERKKNVIRVSILNRGKKTEPNS